MQDAHISQLNEDIKAQRLYISQLQATLEHVQVDTQHHRGEAQRMRELVSGLETEKRLLRDEVIALRQRVDKYSEVHVLDEKDKAGQGEAMAAKDREIARLRDAIKSAVGPAAPSVIPPPPEVAKPLQTNSNSVSSLLKSYK